MNFSRIKNHSTKHPNTMQNALEKSGYNHDLKYEATVQQKPENILRRRNITWYKPPFSKNVATNVGCRFRNIV